jgi:hypothetical protein
VFLILAVSLVDQFSVEVLAIDVDDCSCLLRLVSRALWDGQ